MKLLCNSLFVNISFCVIYLWETASCSTQPSTSKEQDLKKDIFFRKGSTIANNFETDKYTKRKNSGNSNSLVFNMPLANRLAVFEIYIAVLDKPLDELTGIISIEEFNKLDDIIKNQQIVISDSILYFDLGTYLKSFAGFKQLVSNLDVFIESFKNILQIWKSFAIEIINVSSTRINKIEERIKDIQEITVNYKKIANKKKEHTGFSYFRFDFFVDKEFTKTLALYNKYNFSYKIFKEERLDFIINYMSSFDRSMNKIIEKLQIIREKIVISNRENIYNVREELMKIFKLFDINEEDTLINLVKKIKEMNIYIHVELERYDKKYFDYLKKFEIYKPKIVSSRPASLASI